MCVCVCVCVSARARAWWCLAGTRANCVYSTYCQHLSVSYSANFCPPYYNLSTLLHYVHSKYTVSILPCSVQLVSTLVLLLLILLLHRVHTTTLSPHYYTVSTLRTLSVFYHALSASLYASTVKNVLLLLSSLLQCPHLYTVSALCILSVFYHALFYLSLN